MGRRKKGKKEGGRKEGRMDGWIGGDSETYNLPTVNYLYQYSQVDAKRSNTNAILLERRLVRLPDSVWWKEEGVSHLLFTGLLWKSFLMAT